MVVNVLIASIAFCSSFQMTSNDKDFRFMAINDLMAELQKDSIKLDDESERRVIGHFDMMIVAHFT